MLSKVLLISCTFVGSDHQGTDLTGSANCCKSQPHVDQGARSMLMTDFSDRSMWMMEFSDRYMWMTDFSDQSMWMTEFSDRSMWMTKFSVIHMLWACVTLGFCNSTFTVLVYHQYGKHSISILDAATSTRLTADTEPISRDNFCSGLALSPEPKSQDNFSLSQPWTRTALETIGYSTHVLKVKLFFQHLINNVKTHPNLCPVVGRLYLKHENKDKNLITSFPINCGIFLSTDFCRAHVYCTQ
jgi:hypothetical protein